MRIAGKMFLVLVLFAAVTGLSAQTTTQKPKPFEPTEGAGPVVPSFSGVSIV